MKKYPIHSKENYSTLQDLVGTKKSTQLSHTLQLDIAEEKVLRKATQLQLTLAILFLYLAPPKGSLLCQWKYPKFLRIQENSPKIVTSSLGGTKKWDLWKLLPPQILWVGHRFGARPTPGSFLERLNKSFVARAVGAPNNFHSLASMCGWLACTVRWCGECRLFFLHTYTPQHPLFETLYAIESDRSVLVLRWVTSFNIIRESTCNYWWELMSHKKNQQDKKEAEIDWKRERYGGCERFMPIFLWHPELDGNIVRIQA